LDVPASNQQEFIAYTKANEGKLQYGSGAGTGSGNHLSCEMLNSVIGVKVTHVPYRDIGPLTQDTSLARPGGNVTGLSAQTADLAAKRLEIFREVVPGLRRLAILSNVGNRLAVLEMREVQAAASTLRLEVVTLEIQRGEDIAPFFEAHKPRADALYVCVDGLLLTNRIRINTLAEAGRPRAMRCISNRHASPKGMARGSNAPLLPQE
jgi:hypothetical protein